MNWHSVQGTAFVDSENRILLYQEWEKLGHVPLTLGTSFSLFENYKDWTRIFLVYDNSQLPSLLPQEAIALISKLQPVAVVCFGKNLPHHWCRLALWASGIKLGILLWLTFPFCSQCLPPMLVPGPCCCSGPMLVTTLCIRDSATGDY